MFKNLTRSRPNSQDGRGAAATTNARRSHGRELLSRDGQTLCSLGNLPIDVLEHVCHFLEARDVLALSRSCKLLRNVASSPGLWADVLLRSFLFDELPQDLSFLSSRNTSLIQAQFWQLTRQRPAFLSDAPRTSEILEHTGSRFLKVLHIDGRRDLNFTTVFRDVAPGQYTVVWRIMLQPGYVRGYCNFRAVFSRSSAAANAKGRSKAASMLKLVGDKVEAQLQTGSRSFARRFGRLAGNLAAVAPLEEDMEPAAPRAAELQPGPFPAKLRLKRRLRFLSACASAADCVVPHAVPGGRRVAQREGNDADVDAAGAGVAAAAAAVAAEGLLAGEEAQAPRHVASLGATSPHHQPQDEQYQHQYQQLDQDQALHSQQRQPQPTPQIPTHQPEIEPIPPQPELPELPQPQPQPQGPEPAQEAAEQQVQLQRAMGQLASVSAKRDATLAVTGGPRYVSRWLSPLWGSHACAWRQLDPAGPLGHGAWSTLHVGTLTVRRQADVHLHGVMVQLRPANAQQQEEALPPGETQWRGALVDYVELVPTRHNTLLGGLIPGFMQSGSPVFPERSDVIVVPRL